MAEQNLNIAGIILAAGEGRRIGRNKALLSIRGASFLELIVEPMRHAGCEPITVVLGAQADSVKSQARDINVNFVINKNWKLGQFSSLKAGISSLPPDIPGAMMALIDHPLVKRETYELLMHFYAENLDKIIIPIFQGRRGHPIVIPELVMREVLVAPFDLTLKDIIRDHSDLVFEQLVDDPGILQDIDTENDLKTIKQ